MSQYMVKSSQLHGVPDAKSGPKDGSRAFLVVVAVALGVGWAALFAVGTFTNALTNRQLVGIGAALLVMTLLCGFSWLAETSDRQQTNVKREMRRELAFIRTELLAEMRVQIRYLGDEVLKPTFELGRAHERFTGELPKVTAIGRVPSNTAARPGHLQSVKG